MANETKAYVIAFVNSIFAFVQEFGIYDLSQSQQTAAVGVINTGLILWVAFANSRHKKPRRRRKKKVANGN